ncbi:MAG: signal recognition particle subunit SRP19/SEC65 family protein [Candidatus Poseidoniales archaeon]|jgi:signal recognition particle subunit SRP19|tara:strand:- start:9339 stop:9776 length:438 start_codon:yes stop_codon:yes gene_type:complete
MTRDSRKMRIWTRYFDSKLSRSNGRRVPKEASIPNPSLDAIIWAARDAGISKMKREEDAKHPSRPFSKEGMLILSTKDALESTKAESKEGVLQSIGLRLRKNYSNSKLENKSTTINRPGNRQKLSQRKSFKNKAKSSKRKKKFGR